MCHASPSMIMMLKASNTPPMQPKKVIKYKVFHLNIRHGCSQRTELINDHVQIECSIQHLVLDDILTNTACCGCFFIGAINVFCCFIAKPCKYVLELETIQTFSNSKAIMFIFRLYLQESKEITIWN
jgi:hypothetical protein